MKTRTVLPALLLLGSFLNAAEFTISDADVKAVIDTRGGALKKLSLNGKELIPLSAKALSFTEKVMRSEGKKAILEDFSNLDFTPISVRKNEIALSAAGVKNFDFLRITKRYSVKGNELVLDVTLQNLSDKVQSAGFWVRTMLRRDNGMGMRNTYFYPVNGKWVSRTHPGATRSDEWFTAPTSAAAGFMGNDDKTGCVLLLPQDRLCAFYSWFSADKEISTLEYFLKETEIPAKGTSSYQVRTVLSENVPAVLAQYKNRPLQEGTGKTPVLLDFYTKGDKGVTQVSGGHNYFIPPVQTLDIRGRRQYCDSVRGVRIPGTIKADLISVYQLANGAPEFDHPVPFTVEKLESGEQRILVSVPGVNKIGYYYTKFKDGYAWNTRSSRNPVFCGREDFAYRICFDRKPEKSYPAELFEGGPDLVNNGSFEKPMEKAPWPESYYWSWYVRDRKLYQWVSEGPDNSKCIKVVRWRDSTQYSIFPVFFRPEKGVKYTFSADLKGENPERRWQTCMIEFENSVQKSLIKQRISVALGKNSFPWKKVERAFYPPEEAGYGIVRFGIYSPEQTLWLDNVKIVPEDFTYIARSPLEMLRDELKGSSYPAVDILEKISHEYVTPHTKWLADPADPMPEILYLPLGTNHLTLYTGKRQIVEFAQRMKLKYRYIPLFRKVDSGGGSWYVTFGKTLEPYTIAQIKALTAAPKIIIVQSINFKTMVQQEFVDLLKKFQQQGSGILFYNCVNVPSGLLGKRIARPENIFGSVPAFRKVPSGLVDRSCTVYRNGKSRVVCFLRNNNEHYLESYLFACVPPAFAQEKCPSYVSADFPYWEYIYASVLKALRYAAGIEPAVKAVSNRDKSVILQAAKPVKALLKAEIRDMHRRTVCSFEQKLELKSGVNQIALDLPALPGGPYVADYRVTDPEGREYDFGALNFTNPDPYKLSIRFADPEKVFERGKEISAEVGIAGKIPAGTVLTYEVEDTRGRIVRKAEIKAEKVTRIAFRIAPPYTTLYRLRLSLRNGRSELARGFAEFSAPAKGKDVTQLDALVWMERTPFMQPSSELGFTMWITGLMQDSEKMGRLKAVSNANMGYVMFGAGNANYTTALKYRGDIPSDPVRKPCFSDPAHWQKVENILREKVKSQRFRYYGIVNHEIADEAYLGSTVCYSPHCLKDFRAELKQQYGTLEALNQGWERGFKSWDEVVPVQIKEVNGKENLAPWLDHKMFMAKVFASKWVGNTGNILRKYMPGSKAGLSGTQIPGYSYDWVQLMKHIDCLSYYGGIQRKAVHDFAAPGFISGAWNGYERSETVNEFAQRSAVWSDMLLGANLVSNFAAGYAFNGDLTPMPNTKFYTDQVNELRGGIDRVILNGNEVGRDIGVLYSQSSLFASMGSIGGGIWHNSMTGWAALLEDLQCGYFYLPYDSLEKSVPAAKVIVLPCAISLSPRAVENLRKFTAAGGMVIADFAPGWFDEHGTRSGDRGVEKLFGIDRSGSFLSTAAFSTSSRADGPIPAMKGDFRLGEKGIAEAGAKSLGSGILFVNRHGKGSAVLLNILLSGYQEVSLGGVGGENTTVRSGSAVFCENMRSLMKGILEKAGIAPVCTVTDLNSGKPYPCTAMLRRDGDNHVFGILRNQKSAPDGKYPMLFSKKFLRKVKIELPVSGFVYDMRRGKYIGNTNSFVIDLMPGDGQVFSIQKRKITGINVSAPGKVRRGKELAVKFKVGGAVGKQVCRMDLFAPDGKLAKVYTMTGHFAPEDGRFVFQFAMNDRPGLWTCRITHVNSGLAADRKITLE